MKDSKLIKLGKVVELLPKQSNSGFMMRYGLPFGKRSLTSISVSANDKAKSFIYFNQGMSSIKLNRSSVSININNGEYKPGNVEDTLLLIVSGAKQLVTTAETIYKKEVSEAVVFMHFGDTIQLSQSSHGKCSEYKIVKNNNKLFLVLNRE